MLEQIATVAAPASRALACAPLSGGLRNSIFKLELEPGGPVVVRIYQHDPSLCRKELDLSALLDGRVPVPRILYASPEGQDGLPPFTVAGYIEGVMFRELRRTGDRQAIAEAAYSAGQVLAAVGQVVFGEPGWLAPGPTVTAPPVQGKNFTPQFIDECLASGVLRERMAPVLRERASAVAWSAADELAPVDEESRLVHGDFGKTNVLVRPVDGRWSVTGVLDWEFAISGSPLIDIGHFLRYDVESAPVLEPHFSRGYVEAGGVLREGWRRLARIVDLAALCEILTRDPLPAEVVAELVELVEATVFYSN